MPNEVTWALIEKGTCIYLPILSWSNIVPFSCPICGPGFSIDNKEHVFVFLHTCTFNTYSQIPLVSITIPKKESIVESLELVPLFICLYSWKGPHFLLMYIFVFNDRSLSFLAFFSYTVGLTFCCVWVQQWHIKASQNIWSRSKLSM